MKRKFNIFMGNILITMAYAFITVPQGIINGGVTSFSMSMSRIFPLSVSLLVTITTAVIAAACFFTLEKDYFKGSIFCCICYLLLFNLFSSINWTPGLPSVISIPAAAVLVGFGIFLCISSRATTVGTDTIAVIVNHKFTSIPVAYAMYALNVGVMLLGVTTYGFVSLVKGLVFTSIQIFILNLSLKIRSKVEGENAPL